MAQFLIIGRDGPDGLQRRREHRPAHLEHWRKVAAEGRMIYAGPLLNDSGETPGGSVIIFDSETREAAAAEMQSDPYVTGGVFATTELIAVRQVLPE